MTADEFRRAGEFLFGDRWHVALAMLLDVNLRTVQRWGQGIATNPVPADVAADVRQLLAIKNRRMARTI